MMFQFLLRCANIGSVLNFTWPAKWTKFKTEQIFWHFREIKRSFLSKWFLYIPWHSMTSSGFKLKSSMTSLATLMNVSPIIRRLSSGSVTWHSRGVFRGGATSFTIVSPIYQETKIVLRVGFHLDNFFIDPTITSFESLWYQKNEDFKINFSFRWYKKNGIEIRWLFCLQSN